MLIEINAWRQTDEEKKLTQRLRDFVYTLEQEACAGQSKLIFDHWGHVKLICGRGVQYTACCCIREPGHTGKCFCGVHHDDFDPDTHPGDSKPHWDR